MTHKSKGQNRSVCNHEGLFIMNGERSTCMASSTMNMLLPQKVPTTTTTTPGYETTLLNLFSSSDPLYAQYVILKFCLDATCNFRNVGMHVLKCYDYDELTTDVNECNSRQQVSHCMMHDVGQQIVTSEICFYNININNMEIMIRRNKWVNKQACKALSGVNHKSLQKSTWEQYYGLWSSVSAVWG